MTKQLLKVEFRYHKIPTSEFGCDSVTKEITIGIYDTLEDAVKKGNEVLATLSKHFQVREKFEVRGFLGSPNKLVTNTCYPTEGIQYFASIETLEFEDDLENTINEVFNTTRKYNRQRNLDKEF